MKKVTVLMNNGVEKTMDSRFARALVHCRKAIYADDYEKKVIEPKSYLVKSESDEELTELRKQYSDKFGKKCYHGWNAEEIKAKIKSE